MKDLLLDAAERARSYLATLPSRRVAPAAEAVGRLAALDGPLPDHGTEPAAVLALLDAVGSPATVASAGGRYFGFVTGGTLPAALAATILASAWDQNAALTVMSPAATRIEDIALGWLLDILGLPPGCAGGFVSGATTANLTALAAARHALLARDGWDVEAQGLFGAPPITVVVGDEVHVSLLKALTLLGLGRDRVLRVPVDGQGRMRADRLPALDARTLLCIQAGNVNSGAFDPAAALCAAARAREAWVHVDGAFGMWAAAAPARAHLVRDFAAADSWALDAHKWLNVPYDSGVAFCRDARALRAAMSTTAAYHIDGGAREPCMHTPEMSRRARGVEIWAALSSLGRDGMSELVERNCRLARRFADELGAAGCVILNDVELNQVMVAFKDDDETRRVLAGVQDEGTLWCGGTVWHGRAALRISVSSWATTDDDVERSVAAIVKVARRQLG